MTTINPVLVSNKGAVVGRVASTPAGDKILYGGGNILLHFENGAAAPVTVNFVPVKTTLKVSGAGEVTVPTRSLAVSAGAEAAIMFSAGDVGAYLDDQGNLAVTYTGGDAALTIMAIQASF